MTNEELGIESQKIIDKMKSSDIGDYVDDSIPPPAPFRGEGQIKLIIIGRDPSIQDAKSRENIKVTLLANQSGRLKD